MTANRDRDAIVRAWIDAGPRIEFVHPSKLFVTTFEGTRLMVQVWAPSKSELQPWLPAAMQLVDSFELTAAADD